MRELAREIVESAINLFLKGSQPTKFEATCVRLLLFFIVVIFLLLIIKFLGKKLITFRLIDIYYFIKLRIDIIGGEEKRIATLINWRNRKDYKHKEFAYKKVKIVKVPMGVVESFDEEVFTRKTVLVLKQAIDEDNKSENLVKTLSLSIIHGYLTPAKEYISEDLATAINNTEIEEKLRKMNAHKGRRDFIGKKVSNKRIEALAEKIDTLRMENLYSNLLVPYLLQLRHKTKPEIQEIKKDILKFIDWLCDYERRLVEPTTSKFFPKTEFLYVKLPFKNLYYHINRAIINFEKVGCDVNIVSGWKKDKKEILKASSILSKDFGFPSIRKFWGKTECPWQGDESTISQYEARLSIIQLRNKELKVIWK